MSVRAGRRRPPELDAGDFNGDGSSSILITDPGGDICEWTLRNGMFAAASELATLPSGARFLGSGDFQGTGADGLLFAAADGSVVDWTISHGALASPEYAGPRQWLDVLWQRRFQRRRHDRRRRR